MEGLGQAGAVVLVLAALGGALWWLRRAGLAPRGGALWPRRGCGRLALLERLPLGPHHTLYLVESCGRVLLLAASPRGCDLIESGPAGPEEVRR
jgi:flagellar biogenesis protein FliO